VLKLGRHGDALTRVKRNARANAKRIDRRKGFRGENLESKHLFKKREKKKNKTSYRGETYRGFSMEDWGVPGCKSG